MTDPIRLPHSDPADPQGEATAYVHGELTPEERAAFEAHLPTCAACRAAVAMERKLAPLVAQALAARPVKTGEEYLAMADAAQAKLDAAEAAGPGSEKAPTVNRAWPERRKWAPYWPWLVASAVAASVALTVGIPPAPLTELALIGRPPGPIESAPIGPDSQGPPVPEPLAVSARIEKPSLLFWRHPALLIQAPRQRDDRFVEVALFDAKGQMWEVQSAQSGDLSCTGGCGPLELRANVDALPVGKTTVVVLLGPTSGPEKQLRREAYEVATDSAKGRGERAAGTAAITK